MRNGLNIAGVSELVHEVEASPAEAQYRYAAAAAWRPGRGTTGRSEPALLGSVKSPRRFTFAIGEQTLEGHRDGEPDPVALALAALGSCALTTLLGGASSRGVTFEQLHLNLDAVHRRRWGARWLSDLSYTIVSRAATADVDLLEVTRTVVRRSPNHRTVADPQPVTLCLGGVPETMDGIRAPQAEVAGEPVSQRIVWSYGTQLRVGLNGAELRVDQAKQMGGVDWGPNPQEYLLMALASCVVQRAVELTAEVGLPPLAWHAAAEGRVDVRGLLMVDPDIPPQLQDLRLDIDRPDGSPDDWRDLVREAARRSAVVGLLTQPHRIRLALQTETTDQPAGRPAAAGEGPAADLDAADAQSTYRAAVPVLTGTVAATASLAEEAEHG